ncbi:hypothetical protein [Pseudomonas sp. UMAB-40]|uniref:hypothetical protein n=1 Tax=Pseudomonas sp. UMAB-40 TaxID=1365407 RepID=UPI001C567145|nr:hypothetical protein [Pseudomonas sp. UMAB-40]
MATAALYSESSDSVRLSRYKNHMQKASELEALSKLGEVEINEKHGMCDERKAPIVESIEGGVT